DCVVVSKYHLWRWLNEISAEQKLIPGNETVSNALHESFRHLGLKISDRAAEKQDQQGGFRLAHFGCGSQTSEIGIFDGHDRQITNIVEIPLASVERSPG